ncbi:MAG: iron chelate uptake ABC transporter family permease subunit [Mycoplasma sp.]|nr:iron chelate uptake ABC transporter family permease subunit [Mycoplasma sp.]
MVNSKYWEIYFPTLNLKFWITAGIAGSIAMSTYLVQKVVGNPVAETSILGINQINFIVYALILLIDKPAFDVIFSNVNISSLLYQFLIYFSASFAISWFIIFLAKGIDSRFIIIIGILFNIIFSAVTLIIMQRASANQSDFNNIYSKMMGAFASPSVLFNGIKIMTIIINVLNVLGFILFKFFDYRIIKNMILVNRFGITQNRKYWTRFACIFGIAIFTSLSFILSGSLSFFGMGIVLLNRLIFGEKENQNIIPLFFTSLITLTIIMFITDNFIIDNLAISVPNGIFASLVGIPILIFGFLKKGTKNA